jgi:ABC-type glycerol-3-phosphate transport system substrate-binding protein
MEKIRIRLSLLTVWVALFTIVVLAVPSLDGYAADRLMSYGDYVRSHEDAGTPSTEITLSPEDAVLSGDATLTEEEPGTVIQCQAGTMEWTITVPDDAMYQMELYFKPLEGKQKDIELSLSIDGEIPFDGAQTLTFSRVWEDITEITEDSLGNQIRPKMQEVYNWRTEPFVTDIGVYYERCLFFLSKGEHKITISSENEPFLLGSINLTPEEELPTYEEVYASYPDKTAATQSQKVQAEDSYQKNDAILYPFSDRTNAAMEPSHPSLVRLNMIGDENWSTPGKWISWKITVPETGLYKIAFKAGQDYNRGMTVTRRLYIDGEVPFAEAEYVEFPYNENWYIQTVGGDEPYLFYLTEGEHEIRLEAVLGKTAPALETVNDSIAELNELYRKIIKITSTSPDTYRSYNLDVQIPGLMEDFARISGDLREVSDYIFELTGTRGSEAVSLDRMADQLDSFVDDPDSISKRLENYISNVSSLSTWVSQMKEQALRLDYFVIMPPDAELPDADCSFWEKISFGWKAFISSFQKQTSEESEEMPTLKVWVSAAQGVNIPARDMAQIVKTLVDDKFTPEHNIIVDINLVEGSLVQATLAGKGPDISLTCSRDIPVNLAMRGALVDLSEFDDFQTVSERFYPSAFIPYEFNNGTYALPETQNFNMLFYRSDILEELGCEVPQTWDEFYQVASVIQKNNLEVGVPTPQEVAQSSTTTTSTQLSMGMFETFLFQNSLSYYNEDMTATTFDDPKALDSFKEWTNLYTKYGLPLTYDFYNRFRTGQMPLAIASYTQYNVLAMSAPEIRNLWDFAPIPGTEMANGEINRAEGAQGTSCIILDKSEYKEEAWEFLKWWTSAEIQSQFGNEVEAFVGPAARYDTANVEAFEMLSWEKEQAESLKEQWQYVYGVPEIPGGYYVNRNILNAFRNVVYDYENPRETLERYNIEMNKEIERKREELKLD